MKAICRNRIFTWVGERFFNVEEGTEVEYEFDASTKKYCVKGALFESCRFFYYFKVVEGDNKMSYDDFEYILCNYVFGDAVLFPEEYSGVHHLVIQPVMQPPIMITVNKGEDVIRVSFDKGQRKFSTYDDALEYIIAQTNNDRIGIGDNVYADVFEGEVVEVAGNDTVFVEFTTSAGKGRLPFNVKELQRVK